MSLSPFVHVIISFKHFGKRILSFLGRPFGSSSRSLLIALCIVLLIVLTFSYYEQKIASIQHLSQTNQKKIFVGTKVLPQKHARDIIVIYNRVPKTGSTSFMGIAYDLCSRNGFNVIHLNTSKNSHVMSLPDQLRFVWNVTQWTEKQPSLIHGHIAFLNFANFGLVAPKPLYINLIRRPLDRLISYYYFLRNGDNFRPNIIRKKQGDKRTFDECIEMNGRDCRLENLWLQVPFFCGQHSDCWKPGNKWALEQAKSNLVNHYFLVGITEALQEFVQVLEYSLPQLFRGATSLYENGTKSHLRKTFHKIAPSPKTIAKIQNSRIWQMENDFYQFVVENFNFVRDKALLKVKSSNGTIYKDRGKQYFFEKIRPK